MLADIFPTAFHAAARAEVGVGLEVLYQRLRACRFGGGSVARILAAAAVMVGDLNKDRLAHAKKVGFGPIDLNAHDPLGELVSGVIGEPVVNSFIDAVGVEAKGHGGEQPAVLNSLAASQNQEPQFDGIVMHLITGGIHQGDRTFPRERPQLI
jgi:glutathione-independent formaldehyde dehydrogenase